MAHTPTAGDRYKVRLKSGIVVERPYSTAANAALLKRGGHVCIDERITDAQAPTSEKKVVTAKKNPAAEAVNLEDKIAELDTLPAVIEHVDGKEEVVTEPAINVAEGKPKGKPGRKPAVK